MPLPDQITILRAVGPVFLTKQFVLADEGLKKRTWPNASLFNAEPRAVDSLESLSAVLSEIQSDPKLMAIRGGLKSGAPATPIARRYIGEDAWFKSEPRSWVCIDIDDLPLPPELENFNADRNEVVALACSKLPPEFRCVDCHWQYSSSMGVIPGLIKVHLWFWLSEPLSDQHLKAWLDGYPIDRALFNPVQPHFTAAPIFEPAEADPVTVRSGLFRAGHNLSVVTVPSDLDSRMEIARNIHSRPRHINGGMIDPQEVVRDERGKVIDGREKFLWLMSLDAIAELTKGKARPTLEVLTALTWDLFSAEAELSDGRWTRADAEEKSRARLRELQEGIDFSAKKFDACPDTGGRPAL